MAYEAHIIVSPFITRVAPREIPLAVNNRILQSKNRGISLYDVFILHTVSAESAPSRKEAEQHKVLKDRFSRILRRIFLKYRIFLKKFDLSTKKSILLKLHSTLR